MDATGQATLPLATSIPTDKGHALVNAWGGLAGAPRKIHLVFVLSASEESLGGISFGLGKQAIL